LKDVAEVVQAYKEREAITRLNGSEAVEIAIYKEGDANTVEVANVVNERMDQIRRNLPANMKLEKVYDQSVFISSAVNEVKNAGIIGGILAVIVLYLFLRNPFVSDFSGSLFGTIGSRRRLPVTGYSNPRRGSAYRWT
jgi:HAE1 family hydrophobic/amphiphilic exporter-1